MAGGMTSGFIGIFEVPFLTVGLLQRSFPLRLGQYEQTKPYATWTRRIPLLKSMLPARSRGEAKLRFL
jgi:hypothetical protein